MIETPQYPVDVNRVRRHYDLLAFPYRLFWGPHLHHGYWTGNENVHQAQAQLTTQLAQRAGIPRGARVLDIGCGIGASAMWLAATYDCSVEGITISPVQASMGRRRAKERKLSDKVRFEVRDANEWQPEPASFDVVWVMESSEFLPDKRGFIERCARALKPGGTLAVCAWLRRDGAPHPGDEQLVSTIAEAMMSASLGSLSNFVDWMHAAGLDVTVATDITRRIQPTWAHGVRLRANPLLRLLVRLTDGPTQRFFKSFPLMQEAYATGAMAFGLFVAKKQAARVSATSIGA